MYKSKTLRRMPPVTRKLAKELNIAERSIIRIGKLVTAISEIEREANAWNKRQEHYKVKQSIDPINWPEDSMLAKITKGREV